MFSNRLAFAALGIENRNWCAGRFADLAREQQRLGVITRRHFPFACPD